MAQRDLADSAADALDHIASLPSPETFDVVAPLHELLARLLAASSAPPVDLSQDSIGQHSLDLQNISTEAWSIRARVRKARAAVQALPAADKTVEEQEDEINTLRKRIAEQREVLAGVANLGKAQD